MSSIGSFDLCRLRESARVSVVRCWSQNLTCFCSCSRLPPAHTALKHTHTAPTRWDEWVIRASASCLQMLVLTVSGFSSVRTHTHTHVLSCSQAHAHSLTPLTLFAGVLCVSSSCWLCKGAMCLPLPKCQKFNQDKVWERGNYVLLGSVCDRYDHLKWVSHDHLRLHMDLTWFFLNDYLHCMLSPLTAIFFFFKLAVASFFFLCFSGVLNVFFMCASHPSWCQSGKPEKS